MVMSSGDMRVVASMPSNWIVYRRSMGFQSRIVPRSLRCKTHTEKQKQEYKRIDNRTADGREERTAYLDKFFSKKK